MAIIVLAFLFATLFTTDAVASEWKDLHVKYAFWDGVYKIPLLLSEITNDKQSKFVKMSHDEELNVDLYSYPNDPRFSILFDTHGNIAGLRTAYIKEDVAKRAKSKNMEFPFKYGKHPMYTSGKYWGIDLWYNSVLFVSPGKLKSGGRSETRGLVAENIFMKLDGEWTQISEDERNVEAQGFKKQACFVGMGDHYMYKVTPDMDCGDHQGLFLLFESGKLIGLGFNPFGSFTSTEERTWFEDPPAKIAKFVARNGPACLFDWVNNYGTTVIHIFFKKHPLLTFCLKWPFSKKDI